MEKVTSRFSLQGDGDAFDLSAEDRLRVGTVVGNGDLLKWNLSKLKLAGLSPYRLS